MSALASSRLALWLYRAHRVLQKLSGGRAGLFVYLFCAQPVKSPTLASVRADALTRVVPVVEGSDLLPVFPRPLAVLSQRFASGATCFAVLVKEKFAGHIWLARSLYDEDEVRCRYVLPSAATVWDFDVYIAPPFRATRTMARLWKGVAQAMEADGIDWSYSRISVFNQASVQAHERMGTEHLCSGAFLTLGSLQVAILSKPWRLRVTLPGALPPVLNLPLPKQPAGLGPGPAAMVLGLDSHGLAAAHALADAGVNVYALEQDMSLPGVSSNRVRRVFQVQSFKPEHLVLTLRAARLALEKHPRVILLAVNDRHVETVSAHLHDLQPDYFIAWAVNASQMVARHKKTALQAVCERQGLMYPRSVTFSAVQDHVLAADLRYPLILKPSRPLSSVKTLMAHSPPELIAHLEAHPHDLPIRCQEDVPGDDRQSYFGALMLNRGRVVGALAGRRLASHAQARAQTTIAEAVDAPEVLQLTKQFFAGFEFSGPVSLELKRDLEGRYWVIEPVVGCAAFWIELCISSGFSQPLMEFQQAVGQPPQTQRAPSTRL